VSSLDDLLRHPGLWRAREQDGPTVRRDAVPTGFTALDRCLPGGGWPRQGLIEVLADRCGIGELSLLMPALAALCGEDAAGDRHDAPASGGWLAWIAPPYQPYAPALAAAGIDLRRVLVVRPAESASWAMEQALRSGACSAVLGWVAPCEFQVLRRLQLAAEQSQCLAVLFRGASDAEAASPAVMRIALENRRDGLEVRVLKSRGGPPAAVQLGRLDPSAPAAAH
jgi:cell division inhibitor SulA/protein ImuA